MNYWITRGEDVSGPFSLLDVQTMIDRDRIAEDTQVCREHEEWQSAADIAEFDFSKRAPAIGAQPAPVPSGATLNRCPDCGTAISETALECPQCGRKQRTEQSATGLLAAIIIGLLVGGIVFAMIMSAGP